MPERPERQDLIAAFIGANGWGGVKIKPLAGDASFRRYFRLVMNGRRAVLMDAPPPKEDVRPFIAIASSLRSINLHAPEIFAADIKNGLLLLEDLGDNTYTRVLANGGDENQLYKLAVNVLIHIHCQPPHVQEIIAKDIAPYDDQKLLAEACLLTDWYMPAMLGKKTPGAVRDAFCQAWLDAFLIVHARPSVLTLRDYHVDNLIWLPENTGNNGLQACGLLDFQDAASGSAAYDLMSLLEDARRDIKTSLATNMLDHYRNAFPAMDWDAFQAAYAILAAQRHAKVIGIFTRLSARDGKPDYLVHIPRVWRLFMRALKHPALGKVADWLERNLPNEQRGIPPCQ